MNKKPANKLTEKQQRFVQEYLIDLNATQAAIRAGYSKKTANRIASQNLSKLDIQNAIQSASDKRRERVEIDADYVLTKLYSWVESDPADIFHSDGSIKAIEHWPKPYRQFLNGIEINELFEGKGEEREQIGLIKKIKFPDKLKALELLGRHINVQAFTESKKVEHSGQINCKHEKLSEQEIDDRIAELERKMANE